MTKYTPTLAQSGLLAELLRRARGKMTEVARRRADRRRVCAVARTDGTKARVRSHQTLGGNRCASHMNLLPKPIAISQKIRTCTDLRRQIHDDLRYSILNGSSQMAKAPRVILTKRASW